MSKNPEHTDPNRKNTEASPSKGRPAGDFSRERLMDYLQGELTHPEMHRMEKAALEEDFYAEAMEGLSSVSTDELTTDLNALSSRLGERVTVKESHQPNIIFWQRIAAAIALLAASTLGIVYFIGLSPLREQDNLSLSEKITEEEANTPRPFPTQETGQKDSTQNGLPLKNSEKENAGNSIITEERPYQEISPALEEIEIAESLSPEADLMEEELEEIVMHSDAHSEEIIEENSEATAAPSMPYQEADTEAKKIEKNDIKLSKKKKEERHIMEDRANETLQKNKLPGRTLRGRVTYEDGEAIPGVNVYLKGSMMGATTDFDGAYEIKLPEDEDKDVTLTYSFIGLATEEVTAQNSDSVIDVTLTENQEAQLSEVVVSGVGNRNDGHLPNDGTPALTPPRPEKGRADFNQYLKTNLRYPKAAQDNHIEGKVIIAFIVHPDGTLDDFTIKKSLGYGCDEEALRLIRSGPDWEPALKNGSPVADKVVIKVKFGLK